MQHRANDVCPIQKVRDSARVSAFRLRAAFAHSGGAHTARNLDYGLGIVAYDIATNLGGPFRTRIGPI